MPDTSTESAAAREIEQSRVFAAPRELVFTAFTDPHHIAQWWGPNGFTNTVHSMDVRPGGSFRFVMHGPDGKDWPNLIVYTEVVRPERLVYSHGSGEENDPNGFHVTVTFDEEDGGTKVTMTSLFASAEARAAVAGFAIEGGKQTLARLAAYLETM
ncbi:MAG TPA: SRPBCC family protein [Longimicrobium sp.]|nr:SRPBCC family protein [Longimicrobium sp.]